ASSRSKASRVRTRLIARPGSARPRRGPRRVRGSMRASASRGSVQPGRPLRARTVGRGRTQRTNPPPRRQARGRAASRTPEAPPHGPGVRAALSLPRRRLLGPAPSNVHPRVLRAQAQPLLGHLDPAFLAILDEVQEQLRALFGTTNPMTLPL